MTDLTTSYSHCCSIARTRAGNFYYSFLVLPRARRLAMCAVYAFMRHCDDVVDEAGTEADKKAGIRACRQTLDAAYNGSGAGLYPFLPAFRDTVTRFSIPRAYFEAIIDGAEMDISVTRYQTFEDLYRYCYHVASAVGLVCIHIFGFTEGENARRYAELCGVAFQLTNILRDIEEDEKIGRIYIPQEDLDRFACPEEHIRNRVYNEPFRNLMVFQVDRAHTFYRDALPLLPLIDPASRGCLAAMIRIYWQNLHEIERRNYNVFGGKIRLPVWKKLAIAAQAMIRKRV